MTQQEFFVWGLCVFGGGIIVTIIFMIFFLCDEAREWLVERYDMFCFKKRMKRWYNYQLSFNDRKCILNAVLSFDEEVLTKHFYNAGGPLSEEHLKYFFEYLFVFKDRERRSYKDEGWVLINALGAYYRAKRKVSTFITKLTNMGYVKGKNHSYILDLQLEFLQEKYKEYIGNGDLCVSKISLTQKNIEQYNVVLNKNMFPDICQDDILICKKGEKCSLITSLEGCEYYKVKNCDLDKLIQLI